MLSIRIGKAMQEVMTVQGAFRTLRLARNCVGRCLGFWKRGTDIGNLARLGNGMPYEITS
jgi:hypothetical protein